LGPFLPPSFIFKSLIRDGEFLKIWFQDLSYARACNYFNGRKPPHYRRMENFGTGSSNAFIRTHLMKSGSRDLLFGRYD
jgi:hypothetical protein